MKTNRRQPNFLWQGVLILLPVALMAAFGFWAILRERNAVEQEARQRAKEILQSLPNDFGRLAAIELTQYDGPKGGWFDYLRFGSAAWPENKLRKQLLSNTNELIAITNDLADLRRAFPDWNDGPPPIVSFVLDINGQIDGSRPMPPCPPAWLQALSAKQYEAWTALVAAQYTPASLLELARRATAFADSQPPPHARACAEFIMLRAELQSQPATNAVERLMRFARSCDAIETESGVPLTTLALAEALKRAQGCGPTAALWDGLEAEVASPGALTPGLLDEAAPLAAKNPQLSEAIKALWILLADKLAQRDLADAIRQSSRLNGVTTTNLWADARGGRWFCILQPGDTQIGAIISNHPAWTTNIHAQVRCYPKSLVARSFAEALGTTMVALPGYFGISAELEGEVVPLPAFGNNSGDVLAEEQSRMWLPAILRRDLDNGQRTETPFESMPSHPRFTLRIRLADRNLLYAKQRQLQLIFGSLIALSTLAAISGFVAAYRAFQRQQQLSEMKSNFVSSVSHELRAPIASVRLMAENLERGSVAEPRKQNEYFGFIAQECRRLSSLIENILDFSRIEQGRKQYEFEPVNLAAMARQTIQLMEPRAADRQVQLESAIPDNAESAEADGKAIQQALVNLIDNAIKHSPKGACVRVGLDCAPDWFQLWVEDKGDGIPAAEHDKIFERFYRRGSELRRETQGVGIGLSIVKHIVEAHAGKILVRSQPGRGSRFTISLPAKR
ncbi:MAG: HAMP domain-containing sensor histidine kinase [Verrucomicrobiota bacterium]|jgi:signal transduction histidine kinase